MSENISQPFQPLFDPNELIDLKNISQNQEKHTDFKQSEPDQRTRFNKSSQGGEMSQQPGGEQFRPPNDFRNKNEEDSRQQPFKENASQSQHSKMDPSDQRYGKDEGKVNKLPIKSESQIWPGSAWQSQLPRRYKIRVQKTDFTSLRYECFCSRQYLSYCALYQHMVRSHPDFMEHNKRFSTTNAIETVDPVYGFRIKKILRHRKKRAEKDNFTPGDNLTQRTKRRIREQSPQIQKWLREVQGLQLIKEHNNRKLKIYQKKMEKQQQAIMLFNKMIKSYERILRILNITPIVKAIDSKNPLPKLKRHKFAPE